jgi:hypothetical protein
MWILACFIDKETSTLLSKRETKFMEQSITAVRETSNGDFIEELRTEINNGGGFVPFVGSGCSSPSGILMGLQFDEYLAYTVFLCVADLESIKDADPRQRCRWDLRAYGWPSPPLPGQVEKARQWIREKFDEICGEFFEARPKAKVGPEIETLTLKEKKEKGPEDVAKALTCPLVPRILHSPDGAVNQEMVKRLLPFFGSEGLVRGGYSLPGLSPSSEDAIVERAVRALFDWRATLNFLSELKLVGDTLLVEASEPAVIDSFNVHITRGRKPNLTHNMLCHLAGPARFRIILTTNFDTLIEDAFQQMSDRLEVISVSVKGVLPDPELVHGRNTVVKMHGTLWETRADFSLDESPSRDNKRRFFHYVRGTYPDAAGGGFLPKQLLVCGYSGSDNRCVEMIKYVLDSGGPDARVFWVCHNEADLTRLAGALEADGTRRGGLFREKYAGRVIATVCERSDLLLYELFQRVCLSLPRGGFSYQYTDNVPPAVAHPEHESPKAAKEARKLADILFSDPAPIGKEERDLLVADGGAGVLATLRRMVQIITTEKKISQIWLELEDYQNTYCAAYDILLIISIRLGLFQLGPADLLPAGLMKKCEDKLAKAVRSQTINQSRKARDQRRKAKAFEKEMTEIDEQLTSLWITHLKFLIDHYFNIVPGRWVIVLYARNGAGGCSGWTESAFWGEAEFGTEVTPGRFPPFVKALCRIGFHVAYAPYTGPLPLPPPTLSRQAKLKDVLGMADAKAVLTESPEFDDPRPHTYSAMKRWLSAKDPYRYPKTSPPKGGRVVDFGRCMDSLRHNWISHRHRPADGNAADALSVQRDPAAAPYQRNLRFLYAAMLFRQSRHYSAFLCDAVYPCPFRFNTEGIDNDWVRNDIVARDVADLKTDGLFYEKPGGFAWAYRDFRLGLRRIIDSLTNKSLESIEPFAEWRSQYHFDIADWYLRAFYTTGHAIPLTEALFHLYQSIRHILRFRESSQFGRVAACEPERVRALKRYQLCRSAICEMTKALRLGGRSIQHWFGPAPTQAWFSESDHRNRPLTNGDDVGKVLETIKKAMNHVVAPLPTAVQAHANTLLVVLREEFAELASSPEQDGRISRYATYAAGSLLLIPRDEVSAGAQLRAKGDAIEEVSHLEGIDVHSDNKDFWEKACEPIRELAQIIKDHDGKREMGIPREHSGATKDPEPAGPSLASKINQWHLRHLEINPADEYLFYLIQQLNEWAFRFVRRAKLQQLQSRYRQLDAKTDVRELMGLDPEIKLLWVTVTILSSNALRFCRALHPTLSAFEGKERVNALTLYGLGLARLGRFYEAHRRFNEANALLSKIDAPTNSVLLGILKLRRAEAHLLEAILLNDLRQPGKWSGMDAKHLCQRYQLVEPASAPHKASPTEIDQRKRLRRLQIAKLDDAWGSLENAERLLAGRLHSTRWWGRLCGLKLRCLLEQPANEPPIDKPRGWTDCDREFPETFRPLARRIQSQPFTQIYDLLRQGLASCQAHGSLRLRLVDFALQIAHKLDPSDRAAFDALDKVASPVIDDPEINEQPKRIRTYCKQVSNYLESWRREIDEPVGKKTRAAPTTQIAEA